MNRKHRFPRSAMPADLGERIAAARRARGWSQHRLAVRSGISRASVYRAEAGGVARTRSDTIFRIAHALDIDVSRLVPAWPEWDPLAGGEHGAVARERRRALGRTLAEVAVEAGVSEATLSRHERAIGISAALVSRVGDDLRADSDRLAVALGLADAAALERAVRGVI